MGGKRKNNFSRALAEAKQRLKVALRERVRYEAKLGGLRTEIPQLQQTIQALEVQLGTKPTVSIEYKFDTPGPGAARIVDPDIAKLAGPQDLSGMGSIVSRDEDILPDAEGKELVPD